MDLFLRIYDDLFHFGIRKAENIWENKISINKTYEELKQFAQKLYLQSLQKFNIFKTIWKVQTSLQKCNYISAIYFLLQWLNCLYFMSFLGWLSLFPLPPTYVYDS